MTTAELGAYVQSHLRRKGVEVILSGGAAVAIYSRGKYVSKDLDMVNIYSKSHKEIRPAMEEIGFIEEAKYYKHPDSEFYVDFVSGPLAIGDEPLKGIDEIEYSTGVLRVISPTDCVKDRLASYYHWGDRQSLEQAILVAKSSRIDLDEIERWSNSEGKQKEFLSVKEILKD